MFTYLFKIKLQVLVAQGLRFMTCLLAVWVLLPCPLSLPTPAMYTACMSSLCCADSKPNSYSSKYLMPMLYYYFLNSYIAAFSNPVIPLLTSQCKFAHA